VANNGEENALAEAYEEKQATFFLSFFLSPTFFFFLPTRSVLSHVRKCENSFEKNENYWKSYLNYVEKQLEFANLMQPLFL